MNRVIFCLGVTIMCHVASLAVMYIGLCVIQLGPELPDGVCVGLGNPDWFSDTSSEIICFLPVYYAAVIVHFTFLSTFTWLNVMSFDIWWTFRYVNRKKKTCLICF